MNPEDFNYFQSRVSRFITGSNRRSSSGSFLSPRITRLSGIIPKRALPSQIFSRPAASADDAIESSGRGISSLGRVTLDLEIINNNLDRIRQIIEQDYKNTQEINRKETEDFRKRVANRGRIFGRRELGDKKTDVLGAVKKYVGSFFSGTGGAIRALAMFNLLQGILSGDPSKIIGPLLGIGLTYIPAIATGIAGAVATSLVGKLFGGGNAKAAATAAEAAPAATKVPRMRKFGKYAALAGLAATGAALLTNTQEDDSQQQRLEQLTQEQKGLTDPQNLVPIPQDDLKRFENLNKRFEAALDFLMGKGGRQQEQQTTDSGGGGTPPPGPLPDPYDIPNLNVTPGSVGSLDQFKNVLKGTPMESESESIYNTALSEGLNPAFVAGLAGAESSFGAAGIASGTKNPFGLLTGYSPTSYADATRYLARRLRDPQGPYAGRTTFQEIMEKYSPPSQNNLPRHMANIMNVGARSGGDPATLFIPRGFRGTQASVLPSPSAQRQQRQQIYMPPQTVQPEFTFVPVDSGSQTPSSTVASSNDSAISVDTTHPENFLALYSKLIYQVV